MNQTPKVLAGGSQCVVKSSVCCILVRAKFSPGSPVNLHSKKDQVIGGLAPRPASRALHALRASQHNLSKLVPAAHELHCLPSCVAQHMKTEALEQGKLLNLLLPCRHKSCSELQVWMLTLQSVPYDHRNALVQKTCSCLSTRPGMSRDTA